MSLANIYNKIQNQFQVNSIDAGAIELNDVPISGGGGGSVGNLQQVLATGADGGNQSITNVNSLNINGYLNLNSASLGQVHFNNGTNSWQLLTSNDEFLIQNYVNNSLVSQSFLIDNDGNLLLGNSKSATPYLYVMGINGPGRVYDTLYNPLPSNPSGGSAVIYNQNYIIPSTNVTSAIVGNTNTGVLANFVILKRLTNNYEDSSHFVLNINSIVASFSNFEASNFYLDLALISNRNGVLTAITQSDLNKNFVIPLRFSQTNYSDDADFTISDFQIEFYDNSGINDIMLVGYSTGISSQSVLNISSIDMNVRADNIGVYNNLADITS
jgi:hypothetical protein